ncbi:hypothetical protein Clacol_002826 [Clathrus columnatus]|uniref:Uncharacterized protein n=1 Tax=Clathrus columnatus TaxID=1419009 RepID=A0AAV5A562_9AGAM|nr:hypothetical protein Clacol_002826 [Clathrus columnatus]
MNPTYRRPTIPTSSDLECSFRKLKKKRPILILGQVHNTQHEINVGDLRAQDSDKHASIHIHDRPDQSCSRNIPKISDQSVRLVKRDTIFIDVTNKDVIPALKFVFAILDAEQETSINLTNINSISPTSSLRLHHEGPPTPSDLPLQLPPPYVFSSSPRRSSVSSSRGHKVGLSSHPRFATKGTCPLEPQEFAHVFSQTCPRPSTSDSQSLNVSDVSDTSPSIPFPPSPSPSSTTPRVPLLQRKPRLNQVPTESGSVDVRRPFIFGNRSNITLIRSVSALDRHRDCAAYKSTTSVNTIESTRSSLLPRRPVLRSSSLSFFSTPRKFRFGALTRNGFETSSQISLKSSCNIRIPPSNSFFEGDDPFRC